MSIEIIQAQYDQISDCFPKHRGTLRHSNLHVINAFLYIAEHGCKWRGLPDKFGNWHTIYYRVSRWSKSGVLDKAFAKLQDKQIIRIKIDVVSMDSTSVKIHPDASGALKKRRTIDWDVARRQEYQNSYGCREWSDSHCL